MDNAFILLFILTVLLVLMIGGGALCWLLHRMMLRMFKMFNNRGRYK